VIFAASATNCGLLVRLVWGRRELQKCQLNSWKVGPEVITSEKLSPDKHPSKLKHQRVLYNLFIQHLLHGNLNTEKVSIAIVLRNRNWKALISNFDRDFACRDWRSSWLYSVHRANTGVVSPLGFECFLPNPFLFFIDRVPHHSILYNLGTEAS
jgi:hypothetical protein